MLLNEIIGGMAMDEKVKKSTSQIMLAIKTKFGLPPSRPTLKELDNILSDIENLPLEERTEETWRKVVFKHIGKVPLHLYEGLDMSDLNMLYNQLIQALGKKK